MVSFPLKKGCTQRLMTLGVISLLFVGVEGEGRAIVRQMIVIIEHVLVVGWRTRSCIKVFVAVAATEIGFSKS